MLQQEDLHEVRARAAVARLLGTPQSRRRLRRSLGYSLRDVSRLTGLSVESVRRRESSKWHYSRDSLLSPGGLAYLDLIAEAQQIDLRATIAESTSSESGSRASPLAA
jgi:transcriptional regulator with XRE-family HTH domain